MDRVCVKWMDTTTLDGWLMDEQDTEDIDSGPLEVESLGFLIRDEPTYIVVANGRGTMDDEVQYVGIITIPRGCIIKISSIVVKKTAEAL